ncbi:MAG: peptide chain release factor N(5)-glutamine methyltransferase [Chloroflexi bacterium]|nr:peptide chain release factor N(5)-glutamine methyltransferase [Chloroflexota bacterium]
MKLRELLVRATNELSGRRIDNPNLEAEVLLRHVMGHQRETFFASLDEDMTTDQETLVLELVTQRASGTPLAYITGHREFYGLDFVVNPSVLIPRQETELLVEKVLQLAKRHTGEALTVVDVGTGTGAIAVAIAYNSPDAAVTATDVDPEALKVAAENCRKHGVADRVRLERGDLLEPIVSPVDIVVSNPPYLTSKDMALAPIEVKREPAVALHGGEDGLDVIRRLLRQLPAKLKAGGSAFIEIDPRQLEDVLDLAREAFPKAELSFERDLLGLARVVVIAA